MEQENKLKFLSILIAFSYVFTLILFGITYYFNYEQIESMNRIIDNYRQLTDIVEGQINATKDLTIRVNSYLQETSAQMDTVRTEDNLNFFRLWLLLQDEEDRKFIENQTKPLDPVLRTCLTSVDGINFDPDIFTMWVTVSLNQTKESRTIRLSRSAVTCHYFTMEIPCEELCEPKTGEAE